MITINVGTSPSFHIDLQIQAQCHGKRPHLHFPARLPASFNRTISGLAASMASFLLAAGEKGKRDLAKFLAETAIGKLQLLHTRVAFQLSPLTELARKRKEQGISSKSVQGIALPHSRAGS